MIDTKDAVNERPTVLVTGASRGIGRAIALVLAADGYDLLVHYVRDADGAGRTCSECRDLGATVRSLRFDIAAREETADVLRAEVESHGAPYGVVLNAGVSRDAVFPMLAGDDWDQVIHTNLDGVYNVLTPLMMPMIRRRKPGRIVTISSVSGLGGNRGQVNYSAAKAGIIGATKALALELASREITVNCVAPGLIATDMTDGLPVDEMLKWIPAGRIGRPEEVAAAVRFLLAPEAAYITRQVISVNGGMM